MIIELPKLPQLTEQDPVIYDEAIQTPQFRGGYYALRAGAVDPQSPHDEDEIYYVIKGKATFVMREERQPVRAGHVMVVPAKVPHRFIDIEEDITLYVLFARR